MVSALWKACSDGDIQNVFQLLKEASSLDIEIKDDFGVTPLIEAVRNGHVEVVRALLDKGADPTSASSQGRPEQYTSDPAILEVLHFAQSKISSNGMALQESAYPLDVNGDASKRYYVPPPPPPGPYTYYPSMAQGPPIPEGAVAYYPSPPQPGDEQQHHPGGPGNLPPPEVARFIPCRYFPACRYGSSCMFAHPQGPYFQGPLPPPAQYSAPYEPMAPHAYSPGYYAVPPPSFQPPNGVSAHMSPMSPPSGPHQTPSPHPPMVHTRSGSEIVSPIQGHFSSPGGPPPAPYGAMSPVSSYPHPGQAPAPLSIPSLPPHPTPQSPQTMYHNPPQHSMAGTPAPFPAHQDSVSHYPPAPQGTYGDVNGDQKSPPLLPPADGYAPGPGYRDGATHHRRGSLRRGSFGGGGGRKPPCLFFPSGRCRNGDECRFPHIIPEGPGPHHPPHFSGRGGLRQRGPHNANGFGIIEEKLSSMTIQDDALSRQNGAESSSRSQSTETGSRSRYSQGPKLAHVGNGPRVDKRTAVKQRVPNADEFPVLAGATTPPLRSPGLNGSLPNGHGGPTAAQVLQAPPPTRKDSTRESSTRGGTPDMPQPAPPPMDSKSIVGTNGNALEVSYETVNKLPVSFATIATAAPDVGKEVSVSA